MRQGIDCTGGQTSQLQQASGSVQKWIALIGGAHHNSSMCAYDYRPMDISQMRGRSIRDRRSKIQLEAFAHPYAKGSGVAGLMESLPGILAGRDFGALVDLILKAQRKKRAIIWGMGGHVIKCGLAPILIDLMDRHFITAIAMNGAAAIHDFEIALAGATSEDVKQELNSGDFGTSEETAQGMNHALSQGVEKEMGAGEAWGHYIHENPPQFPFAPFSLMAAAYQRHIPVTVHIAIGTDIIHNHPSADGGVLGKASLRDFRLLTSIVKDLHAGGIYLNWGSAVLLPEVFLKAVNMVRNLGNPLEDFTTANLDFIQHYRPTQNVVQRPTAKSGQGIALTGHHEILLPLLAATLIEKASDEF